MAQLQRPATLKEFLIHSLLVWRDRDTLVDRDDVEPTMQLRRPDSDAAPEETPRSSRSSFVFDLRVVPRVASNPALPTPPLAWPALRPVRRRPIVPTPPSSERQADLLGAILLALVVLAALVMAR